MARFLSDEWIGLMMEEVNSNMELPAAGKGLDACIQFSGTGPGTGESIYFWVHLKDGRMLHAAHGKADSCDFLLSGDRPVWRSIIEGNEDPLDAIMEKKLLFEGNVQTVMKYVKAIGILIESAGKVPTDFDDPGCRPNP